MSQVVNSETKWSRTAESEMSLTAQRAFFNPMKDVREQALTQLRAESAFSPEMWQQLDEATGVTSTSSKAELTADSTLQVDSWAQYADTVLNDQFVESTIVDQLISAGFGVNSSLSRYAYFNPLSGVSLDAEVSMNLRTQSEQRMPAHGLDGVPLPMHLVTYEIDAREYQNAQAFGEDFDSSVGTEARRALNRSEANMLWSGWGDTVQTERGALTVSGLDTSSPDEILAGSSSTGWIGDATQIEADVDELQDTIEDQTDVDDTSDVPLVSEVGGWVFVPRAMWGEFTREDYETSATDEPIMARLERKYPYLNFTPAQRLDSDSLILMLNDPRYFQIVNAQSVTNTSWETEGGAALHNRVISSRTPFVRTQPDGIAGIARLTGINA